MATAKITKFIGTCVGACVLTLGATIAQLNTNAEFSWAGAFENLPGWLSTAPNPWLLLTTLLSAGTGLLGAWAAIAQLRAPDPATADDVEEDGDRTRKVVADTAMDLLTGQEDLRAEIVRRDIPVHGVARLTETVSDEGRFRDFLSTASLPYFSRAQFCADTGRPVSVDEDEIVARLAARRENGLVIFGPGGSGKTRLGRELALRLERDHGRAIYEINPSLRADDLARFDHFEQSADGTVFLLDYGEAAEELDRLAVVLKSLCERSDRGPVLIVTCRSSAIERVLENIQFLEPNSISVGHEDGAQRLFQSWVVGRILAHGGLDERAGLRELCGTTPALAAFALFLHRHHPARFDEQFGNLLATRDFAHWLDHRASLLCREIDDGAKLAADLALRLPLACAERDAIVDGDDARATLVRRLEEDRWIERSGDEYVAAHDVLADGLAARWLFKVDGQETVRVRDVVRRACAGGVLPRVMVALERLAAHRRFAAIDGSAIARDLLDDQPEAFRQAAYLLLAGRLLDARDKVLLLQDERAAQFRLGEFVAGEPGLRVALAGIAEDIAERAAMAGPEDLAELEAQRAFIVPLIDEAIAQPSASNMLHRTSYLLAPERYRGATLRSIETFPTSVQTHFLIAELMRAGESLYALRPYVVAWLAANATHPKASFIYAAWLTARGDLETVAEPLRQWVAENGLTLDAQFVIPAWLRAGGDPASLDGSIARWLDRWKGEPSAQHLLTALVQSGHADGTTFAIAIAWLEEFVERADSRFLLAEMIRTGEEAARLDPLVDRWLEAAGTTEEGWYVIASLLAAEPASARTGRALEGWLAQNGGSYAAGHVYSASLEAGAGPDAIRAPLMGWLARYYDRTGANWVMKDWIDCTRETETLRPVLERWLETEAMELPAEMVLRAWVDAGGDVDLVRDAMFDWIHEYRHVPQAMFVAKPISQMEDLPDRAIQDVAIWAHTYYTDEDAPWRLYRLVSHLGSANAETRAIFADAAVAVLDFRKDHVDDDIRMPLANLLGGLGLNVWSTRNPGQAMEIAAHLVRSQSLFNESTEYFISSGMPRFLLLLLQQKRLDPRADAAALRTFLDTFRRLARPEVFEEFLGSVRERFPAPVWDDAPG